MAEPNGPSSHIDGDVIVSHGDFVGRDKYEHHHYQTPPPLSSTAPQPPQHFVGRRDIIGELAADLKAGHTTAITALQGMGGIGKTATAQKLAVELADHFTDGIFWGSLVDHSGQALPILRAWLRTCGHQSDESDPDLLVDTTRNALTVRRREAGPLLLIVDDVRPEWIEGASRLTRTCPPQAPMLLTTRHRELARSLHARVRQLDMLDPADALDLLHYHTGDAAEVVDDEPTAAADLIEAVGYLPLGVELDRGLTQR